MTPDEYVDFVLRKYEVPRGPNSPAERLGAAVAGPLKSWADQYLDGLQYSGSYAKETSVRGASDVDVFISLTTGTPGTLADIYENLYAFAQSQNWSPRRQNVSVGVTVGGTRGDLVPGRRQSAAGSYHSLYVRKRGTWTQTDVARHVQIVRQAGRSREIRAVKIWRLLHRLDFPSLYLELFTIRALAGRSGPSTAENVVYVLNAIGSSFATIRIEDPANSNNILSDDLTSQEKQRVAAQALQSAGQPYWENIIW